MKKKIPSYKEIVQLTSIESGLLSIVLYVLSIIQEDFISTFQESPIETIIASGLFLLIIAGVTFPILFVLNYFIFKFKK